MLVVTVTSLAFVVAQLDVSIVNLALPQIAQSYGAGMSTLQWVVDAYTLAFAVLMLSAGYLSDRIGALRIFQIGILIFGLASAGCGFAGLFVAKADTPYWQLFFPFLIMPVGMGMAVPAMINGILANVDKTLSGTASAVLNTIRQTGGAIGVAAFGAFAAGGQVAILSAIPVIAILAIVLIGLTFILTAKYVKG